MANFLIDTDVLIDISRGNNDAADFVDALPGGIFIGRVSAMELMIGARNKHDQNVIEQFIGLYQIKELSDSIGRDAYDQLKQYAKSHGLALGDALIAAIAMANDLTLVSRNDKHFRPIKGELPKGELLIALRFDDSFGKTMEEIRCEGLTKSFDGVKALADFHLVFPSEGITAIIGPNGAGKTTLINVLTGFIRPNSGRVFFDERDITRLAPHKIARLGIARTFQDLRLILQVPVIDNVMLARPNQRGERLFYALTRIGVRAEEKRNREVSMDLLRFVGLEEKADEMAGELSYGQQKLLTLACCLATEAKILLLDEPVAGVHPEMALRILDFLKQLRDKGKLVVFIEHDISAVRAIAEHVIVMDHGKIIAQGIPSEVLERAEIMEAYLG